MWPDDVHQRHRRSGGGERQSCWPHGMVDAFMHVVNWVNLKHAGVCFVPPTPDSNSGFLFVSSVSL